MIDKFIFFYFLSSIVSILVSIFLYNKFKILDVPTERKIHLNPIPLSGGFAAFILINIFCLYCILVFKNYTSVIFLFYIVIFLLFILGLADDLYQINPQKRIIATIIIYLFFFSQDVFNDNDNFFLINIINIETFEITFRLNLLQSLIITIFCVISFQNAMNMIDGINGLSSMILIIINLFIFYYSLNSDYLETNKFIIIFLIIFFMFNIRSKLFFGESGIYLTTFITSLLIIFCYKRLYISVEQIILLLIIPGLDMIRVSLYRLINKISISRPDKNHLHHIIISQLNDKLCLLIVFLLIVPFNLLGVLYPNYTIYLIILCIIFYVMVYKIFKKSHGSFK